MLSPCFFMSRTWSCVGIQGEHGLRSRSFAVCIVKMLAYTTLVFLMAGVINVTIKVRAMREQFEVEWIHK